MSKGKGELKANQVLALEDGREFLVAVVQRDKDSVQVTGLEPGGIGCTWVKRDQLRKATKDDYARAQLEEPADADDQDDDAGDDAGDAQA